VGNQYQGDLARSNAQNANAANLTRGLATLGTTAVMMSDVRLKSNIERVGTHPLGIGIYEYDIFGARQRGVMAQEVLEVKPEAVEMVGDYYAVDYGQL